MAMLVFAMNLSLDGYVDHEAMAPCPALFRHWIENQGGLAGSIYGRRMYETLRYGTKSSPRKLLAPITLPLDPVETGPSSGSSA